MLQNMPSVRGSREERALSKMYKELDSNHRQTLLSFANFLVQQQEEQSATPQEKIADLRPLNIPRPKKESVIKAIRRLSANYPMIDTDTLFDSISKLMTSHIMEGRSAEIVIDDLQELFKNQYAELSNG
jgi:gentisate 1,2-dioxygenase